MTLPDPAIPPPPGFESLPRELAERTAELAHAQGELSALKAGQRESQAYFEKSFHESPALMGLSRLSDRKITEANPAFSAPAATPAKRSSAARCKSSASS